MLLDEGTARRGAGVSDTPPDDAPEFGHGMI
jgi:hypothetical protein